jgi:hypothetical protein
LLIRVSSKVCCYGGRGIIYPPKGLFSFTFSYQPPSNTLSYTNFEKLNTFLSQKKSENANNNKEILLLLNNMLLKFAPLFGHSHFYLGNLAELDCASGPLASHLLQLLLPELLRVPEDMPVELGHLREIRKFYLKYQNKVEHNVID